MATSSLGHVREQVRLSQSSRLTERPSGPNPKDCTSPPADRWSAKDSSPRCEISHSRQRIKGPTLRASCTPDCPVHGTGRSKMSLYQTGLDELRPRALAPALVLANSFARVKA